jgi:NADPH-dependent ferric siderophore reductase
MTRVTLAGPELEGFEPPEPAASVRVLLPSPGSPGELVMPAWNGNEFLLPTGRRPLIRTFTPRRFDPTANELDVDVVLHGDGAASQWASSVTIGTDVAVSGPGRGYSVDGINSILLAGDESAIPAISQLLEALAAGADVGVLIEVARPDGRIPLPPHPSASVEWCDLREGAPPGDAMVDAVRAAEIADDQRVWVAGEAAAVQRIRKHLFEERGLSRTRATVRGYWKHGRAGAGTDG